MIPKFLAAHKMLVRKLYVVHLLDFLCFSSHSVLSRCFGISWFFLYITVLIVVVHLLVFWTCTLSCAARFLVVQSCTNGSVQHGFIWSYSCCWLCSILVAYFALPFVAPICSCLEDGQFVQFCLAVAWTFLLLHWLLGVQVWFNGVQIPPFQQNVRIRVKRYTSVRISVLRNDLMTEPLLQFGLGWLEWCRRDFFHLEVSGSLIHHYQVVVTIWIGLPWFIRDDRWFN